MKWSKWRPFPNPERGGLLIAPFGPGCYQLRLRKKKRLILFGQSGHVAHRMTSLLPNPRGTGTRRNSTKRTCVHLHISEIEYQTIACKDRRAAKKVEENLRKDKSAYMFKT
ncbi:MAG: hypothetical protein FJX42_10370 [Alphaproteobacteria bacterium]|nr:hypothetical protein [Alphaproteobacteria bacterium]